MGHSKKHYIKTWAALCVLLMISVLGPLAGVLILTLVTAFGVACVKAYLVIVNFMHLPLDRKYCTYLLATCLAFMLLLFAFVAPDVMNHEGRNWINQAAKIETKCTELDRASKIEKAKWKWKGKAKCKKMTLREVVALAKAKESAPAGGKHAPKGPAGKKTHETPKK